MVENATNTATMAEAPAANANAGQGSPAPDGVIRGHSAEPGWFSPVSIRNTFLRRLAMFVVWPVVTVIKAPEVLLAPFCLVARMWREAWRAALDEFDYTMDEPDVILLRRAWIAMWSRSWPTDKPAAIAEAVRKVPS